MVPDMIFCIFIHDCASNFTQVTVLNASTVCTGDSHDAMVPCNGARHKKLDGNMTQIAKKMLVCMRQYTKYDSKL